MSRVAPVRSLLCIFTAHLVLAVPGVRLAALVCGGIGARRDMPFCALAPDRYCWHA